MDKQLNVVFAVIIIMIVGCLFMWGKVMGQFSENDRIYNKCLTTNGTMAYNEADKMCKDIVK